ncbi:sensor histidine kinase [Cohnella rhizosphaerae]|uniref:histidine kinase n=1 Tax=Cohnella rhizosphaerae TaxID=1457232 RepID=A0A9X4KTB0_9BACL|nr:sensor histidine kinase [Cohnella rhizosphaerae]MDG0810378.1 sensor histidine kinase [Cohnella rhizosphaerae]
MVARLNQAINDNYIVKIKQKEAELSALQSKINPHFLNNTLQSLHAMAVLDKTREIETTIESLGSLFDYVLYETGDIVKAQEEMNYLESYLQIQQSRNSKRFEYAIEADAEAANCRMPKLLIQPIVENAILHGLGDSWSGGLIEVRLHYSAGRLEIRVTDNGKGMTAEQREHIDRLLRDEDTGSRSIGLKNVYDRLRLIHGSEGFTFGIESSPGEGTTILVGFPASTEY